MKSNNKGKFSSGHVRIGRMKKLNPFDVHVNRSKHHVLGRKLKGDRGLPGVSKSKALMKRKATLLQEYKENGKNNQFIDQRIGEKNINMTEDDRIMARFAAESMRMFNKKAVFRLSDTEVLTHKGQTLSEIERFEDTMSDDEEDDGRKSSGALTGKFVESAHFGGGIFTKSKQDRESLIDDLINESKKRKAERQRNKEETLEVTEQLDEEWKTLGIIVTSNKSTCEVNSYKKDQYDVVMRQLKFEPHGQPSQRLRTEEEIAKEDKEQLEKLEKVRLKKLREIELNKHGYHKSADDLDDWFGGEDEVNSETISDDDSKSNSSASEVNGKDEDEKVVNGNGSKGEEEKKRNEQKKKHIKLADKKESEEINEVDKILDPEEYCKTQSTTKNTFEESSEDGSSDEECAMDDFTDLMPPINDKSSYLKNQAKTRSQSNTTTIKKKQVCHEAEYHVELDLPFVLNIPETYESFRNLFKNKTVKEQNLIFERLIKSNHPSLQVRNKEKMLRLAEYIIELVSKGDITWESMPVFVSQFNIVKEYNKEKCLEMMIKSLSSKLEHHNRNTLLVNEMKYLTWYILVSLRPQGSDVLVPVREPAVSLACSLVTRTHHFTVGLLCCCLLLQDAKQSFVLYPEVIKFLNNCIVETTVSKHKSSENGKEKDENTVKNRDEAAHYRLNLNFDIPVEEKEKLLYCSVMFLSDFVRVYKRYPQSKIMFRQVKNSVTNLIVEQYPPTLKKAISEIQILLELLSSAHLPSLVKTAKRIKALRLYEPSFHTVKSGKSQRGIPAEQLEELKLLHKYKLEKKGAMRELRRDRVFLANIKRKERAFSDEQRMKKVKEIFSSAAVQQGELRCLKRKK